MSTVTNTAKGPIEDHGPQIIAVAASFLALTWIFSLMRLWCRIRISKSFGVDDYLALISQLLFTAFSSFSIIGVPYGTGRHLADIPNVFEKIPVALMWWWVCEPMFIISNMCLKLSIGIFLLRLAVTKFQRHLLWGANLLTVLSSMYFFFLFIFQCWPITYFWTQWAGADGNGKCIDAKIIINSIYIYSSISCTLDWAFCIFPSMIVWKLPLNLRTRISVIGILILCAAASIIAVVRIPFTRTLGNKAEFPYASVDMALLCIVEVAIGIIALSAATLRPLFRVFLGRSKLSGNTAGNSNDKWPTPPSRMGYIRSNSNSNQHVRPNDAEVGFRSELEQKPAITTVIGARVLHSQSHGRQRMSTSNGSQSEPSIEGDNSDDNFIFQNWGDGIQKTVVVARERV